MLYSPCCVHGPKPQYQSALIGEVVSLSSTVLKTGHNIQTQQQQEDNIIIIIASSSIIFFFIMMMINNYNCTLGRRIMAPSLHAAGRRRAFCDIAYR